MRQVFINLVSQYQLIPSLNVSIRVQVSPWPKISSVSGIREGMQRGGMLLGRWFRIETLATSHAVFHFMNIKETYLRVIGHNTLLIFVIRYRGPRQFISLLFHRISRLLTISIDFRSIHKKKKKLKFQREISFKKKWYFPSLFPILIYSLEIVTKN